jgi:trigger factor
MNPGESRDVSATFPDDYPAEDLAGKAAVFQVTLKELKVRELPDLDDDFAQRISQYASYEELVAGLETRYKQEAEDQEYNNKVQACVQKLVENVEAEFPKTLVDEQCNILMQQMLNQFSQQGIDLRQLDASFADKLRQAVEPEAIDELKKRFGLLQLAKLEKIDVDAAAVTKRMGEILSAIENPKKVDINRLQTIAEDELMQDACMEWLLEHNTIEMVPPGTLTPEEDLEEDLAEETEDAAEATVEVTATESEEA